MLESFQSTKLKKVINTNQNNEYTKQFENNFMDS